MRSSFQFLRRAGRCGRYLGAEGDEEAPTSKEESLEVDVPSPNQATAVHFTQYPNQWAKIRETIREPAAEMLGTMILILVGNRVNCQFALSGIGGSAGPVKHGGRWYSQGLNRPYQ